MRTIVAINLTVKWVGDLTSCIWRLTFVHFHYDCVFIISSTKCGEVHINQSFMSVLHAECWLECDYQFHHMHFVLSYTKEVKQFLYVPSHTGTSGQGIVVKGFCEDCFNG